LALLRGPQEGRPQTIGAGLFTRAKRVAVQARTAIGAFGEFLFRVCNVDQSTNNFVACKKWM
jgi:hypothetical protein